MNTPNTPPEDLDELEREREREAEDADQEDGDIHLRETAEYIQEIGPEDEDRDVIEEGLEEYGFDVLSEDNFVSEVAASSDNPDWMSEEALKRADADFPHNQNPDGMYDNDDDEA